MPKSTRDFIQSRPPGPRHRPRPDPSSEAEARLSRTTRPLRSSSGGVPYPGADRRRRGFAPLRTARARGAAPRSILHENGANRDPLVPHTTAIPTRSPSNRSSTHSHWLARSAPGRVHRRHATWMKYDLTIEQKPDTSMRSKPRDRQSPGRSRRAGGPARVDTGPRSRARSLGSRRTIRGAGRSPRRLRRRRPAQRRRRRRRGPRRRSVRPA